MSALKACVVCDDLSDQGRCPAHRRGTRQERGYDASYDQALRDPDFVEATCCASCGRAFTVDNPKTGGHVVAIRHGGVGGPIEPQCQDCNYGWRRSGL